MGIFLKERLPITLLILGLIAIVITLSILLEGGSNQRTELKGQLQEAEAEAEERSEELKELNEQLAEVKDRLSVSSDANSKMAEQTEMAEKELESKKAEAERLQAELEAKKAELEKTKKEYETLKVSKAEEKNKVETASLPSRGKKPEGGTSKYVEATAYTAFCDTGCIGVTATGVDVSDASKNYNIIAVDPNVIPLYSLVEVEGYGTFTALDTGGAIKGNKIDILVSSKKEAMAFGRKQVKINIIRYGK